MTKSNQNGAALASPSVASGAASAIRGASCASCGCSKTYTLKEWLQLPHIGTIYPGDGGPNVLMRNCAVCKSSMGEEI